RRCFIARARRRSAGRGRPRPRAGRPRRARAAIAVMTLSELNRLDQVQFVAALASIYEHSPWVPERAWSQRPFADIDDLHAALAAVVAGAGKDEQLALIRAHPELAGKAMAEQALTADSTAEQSGAGLTHCSSAELARLRELNTRHNADVGVPAILAVSGYDRAGVSE